MNILKMLVLKDLKLNKKRTIGTIVGVLLSCALITVIGLFSTTLRNTLLISEINSNGYYHVRVKKINENELKGLKLNRKYSNVLGINVIGDTLYENNPEEKDGSLIGFVSGDIYSMSEDDFKELKYTLLEGEFPKNKNEILINRNYAYFMNLKVGDSFEMPIGEAKSVESDGIIYSWLTNYKIYNMKVVGIINRYGDIITTGYESDTYNAYVTLKNPNNYVEEISDFMGVDNYKKDYYGEKYYVNENVLRWEVFDFSDETIAFLSGVVLVVVGIIMVTSIFAIRNSFAISTTEKLKEYGMLASVGATKKQIRKMVLFEGFVVGLIGISLGIILGIFVTFLLTIIINVIAENANLFNDGTKLYYDFSIIPIIISILVSVVVIFFSVITSAIKASHTSPIKNIRNSDDIKSKKLKVPKLINKIFGIGGVLSYKNLKRSKKKYRVTIISLTVSILVFITASSLVEYGIRTINDEYGDLEYNVRVSTNGIDKETLNKIENLGEAYSVYYTYPKNSSYRLTDSSHIIYRPNDYYIEYDYSYNIVLYNEYGYKSFVEKNGWNYEELKDKFIILNKGTDLNNQKKTVKITDYKKGDIVKLINDNNNILSFEIGGVSEINPIGETNSPLGVTLVGNIDYFKYNDDFGIQFGNVYFDSKDAYNLEKEIKEITDKVYVENIDEVVSRMRSVVLIVSIIVYGFIIVVTLIGVTSVFNTINSNMELRSKDFATLKSIGMTKKEFNNMINLEAIFYSFKSLTYGTVLGVIGSYIVYRVFLGRNYFKYIFPIKPIIISIVFILLLVLLIMRYSIKKINKQNIIETIRNNNI